MGIIMTGIEFLLDELGGMREALTAWTEDELLEELIYRSEDMGRAAKAAMTRQLRKSGYFRTIPDRQRMATEWLGDCPWRKLGNQWVEPDGDWQMTGTVEELLQR